MREKGVEHRGLCGEFPCDYYLSTCDLDEGIGEFSTALGSLRTEGRSALAWLKEKAPSGNPDPKSKKQKYAYLSSISLSVSRHLAQRNFKEVFSTSAKDEDLHSFSDFSFMNLLE